ncbi:MAG: hypothetical protein ACREQ4_13300 [Candidatus Binataceae bacterium]
MTVLPVIGPWTAVPDNDPGVGVGVGVEAGGVGVGTGGVGVGVGGGGVGVGVGMGGGVPFATPLNPTASAVLPLVALLEMGMELVKVPSANGANRTVTTMDWWG